MEYPKVWLVLIQEEGKWGVWNTYRSEKAANKGMAFHNNVFKEFFNEEPPPMAVVLYEQKPTNIPPLSS